jgi:hypothetical protein
MSRVFRGEPRFPAIPRPASLRKESGRCQATQIDAASMHVAVPR